MKRGHYKETTQFLEDNKELLQEELKTTTRSELAEKYGVSLNTAFLILGKKEQKQYSPIDKTQVEILRQTMSDRAICRYLHVPMHYFYNHIEKRGEPRGIRKPAPKIVRTEIHFTQMEHKPYWDTTTEVPTLGPIKGIRYTH